MSSELANGWKFISAGETKTIKYNDYFYLAQRKRPAKDVLPRKDETDEIFKNSSEGQQIERQSTSEKASDCSDFQDGSCAGSFPAMGKRCTQTTPATPDEELTALLSHFTKYPSLVNLRSDTSSLVIGFDSEWYGSPRRLISWQFALVKDGWLHEYVFVKKRLDSDSSEDLWLELALARILDDLDMPRIRANSVTLYKCIDCLSPRACQPHEASFSSRSEAVAHSKYFYINGAASKVAIEGNEDMAKSDGYERVQKVYAVKPEDRINITLVGHKAIVDLTSLNESNKYRRPFLKSLTEAQGGVFSGVPVKFNIHSVQRSGYLYIYPISVDFRDSMCSAPAGQKSLKALGSVIGVEKVALPEGCIEQMDVLRKNDLPLFLDYASGDAVVALLYTSSIYGVNRRQAVTLLSAGTNSIHDTLRSYFGCGDDDAEFEAAYRGLKTVGHGKKTLADSAGFIESTSLEPLNRDASILQMDASNAYHGGYNSCSDVGYYAKPTFDYDLQNAYPTGMCLVPDVDWSNCIKSEFSPNHRLTLKDFIDESGEINVFQPIFAYVEFQFPTSVKYPCIPINEDGVLMFPRTSHGLEGVYAVGPELYLAVRLGARVTVKKGYVVRTLKKGDGSVSHSLKHAVKQLVVDRRAAKKDCGKGSIEELVLKLIVNGGYGKVAQDVVQKRHWSAYKDQMEDIGCSKITNPVSASMITSIIRATLLAAQNQITEAGYTSYSVTTDGFISDVPADILKTLDLYGMRDALGTARLFLTDGESPEIWEVKHQQNDLVNFTTRGNVSLNTGANGLPGVCAHNGAKSGYESDSYDDRLWTMTNVLSRTGSISCEFTRWTEFKELVNGAPFIVSKEIKNLRMDYDLKRKPVPASVKTVYPEIEGEKYEIANFTTVPFENVAEFLTYRAAAENMACLRTSAEWNELFNKLSVSESGARPRNMQWSMLMSVITGYRAGFWDIPALDNLKSVDDKCEFINRFNNSGKRFKVSDWKNARRPERAETILPKNLLTQLIDEMQSFSKAS